MILLVVDGDAKLRGRVRAVVEGEGHTVVEAVGAAEAIHTLARTAVSMVITDLYLPRMDGIDLLHFISHRGAATAPKVIAMIGEEYRGRDATLAAASLLGARSVLCKPFTTEELKRALEQVGDVEAKESAGH